MRTLASRKSTRAQVMVIGALMSMVFVFFWLAVLGIGEAVSERTHLQDAADAMAYSQATWCARWLNWLAYSNRAIVANFIILCEFAIMHSHAKFYFDVVGVFGLVADALKALFGIGAALDPFVSAAAKVVHFYEMFTYYLADIGIPVYHVLNGILHVLQNGWFIMLIIFPVKGNQTLAYMDSTLYDEPGGADGVGSLISTFTSSDTGDSGGVADMLGGAVQAALKFGLMAYTYYQYFMLMMNKTGDSEGSITSKIGATMLDSKSMFNPRVSVWKRWKWITEETAHKHAQTKPWSWDNRGLFNFNFTLNLGIIKFIFSSGGETHFERWSLFSEDNSINFAGLGTTPTSQKGPPLYMIVGLWQWHATATSEPGYKTYDAFAQDFFELKIRVWFPFVGWKTVFSLGIHEVELASEIYTGEEADDAQDPSETAADQAETTEESAEGMDEQADEWYEDAEEMRDDAEDLRDDADEYRETAGDRRAEGNESSGETYENAAEGAHSSADSKDSSAAAKDADADAKKDEASQTSDQADQLATNAANLSGAIDEVVGAIDGVLSTLYHDGPVLFFWGYMVRWGAGSGPSPRSTKERFVFPNIGSWTYKDRITPPFMWEVNTGGKYDGYTWPTEKSPGFVGDDGRSPAHYVYLFREYRNLIKITEDAEAGLEAVMFGDPASGIDTPMLFDQYQAFSRGEVFYANPFAKDEIPNVFNPWWQPRLSPISKDINSLLDKTGLDLTGGFGGALSGVLENIIPH